MVKFKPYFERRYPRVEKTIAIIALMNLVLVFFNLSYLNLRQFYIQTIPGITHIYDPVKGIKPHPETAYYQAQVAQLEKQLTENEGRSPAVEASLRNLRELSPELLRDRTFTAPNGAYILAMIEEDLSQRTGESLPQSAFNTFWSSDYLDQKGWQQELAFWHTKIQPYFSANYYRKVNAFGAPVDYFWLIDLPFMLIFAVDVTLRIVSTHYRNPGITWANAALRRWYDIFLFLPVWRGLRLISVTLRMYQVDLLNLEPIRVEAQRDIIVAVGVDLAGIVGIEIIDQMQDSVRCGNVLDWVPLDIDAPDPDVPNALIPQQEFFAIAHRLYETTTNRILPRLQPDLEDLVEHSLTKTLEQVPGYPQLHYLPGVGQASAQVVQQLSSSVAHSFYHTITGAFLDSEGQAITERLQQTLREAIVDEFNRHNTSKEIRSRLIDVLEEFKYKYVRALADAGGEQLAARIEYLHRQIR